jgi:CubicO group peptidase (beta-lactamase class C family)
MNSPRLAWMPVAAAVFWAGVAAPSTVAGSTAPRFPGRTWEERSPAEVGLEAARLDAFAANVGGDGVVIKDGYLVKSWGEVSSHRWWASASKPVFSTLLLLAVEEGRLPSVDAPVHRAGWELAPKDAAMTFRQLANMTSGYACAEKPGEAWGYNDFAIQLYARSLERIFGQPVAEAFAQRFGMLQFEDGAFWGHRNNLGVVASPRDFARLGWLWLNRGRWGGREVVPERLFVEHIRPQVPAGLQRAVTKNRAPDDYLGLGSYGGGTNQTPHGPGVYGFNFWFNAPTSGGARVWPAAPLDTYQANGLWNRDTLTVFPGLRMVVAVRGANPGKFAPGEADSAYDRNLRLLVEAAGGAFSPAVRSGTSAPNTSEK